MGKLVFTALAVFFTCATASARDFYNVKFKWQLIYSSQSIPKTVVGTGTGLFRVANDHAFPNAILDVPQSEPIVAPATVGYIRRSSDGTIYDSSFEFSNENMKKLLVPTVNQSTQYAQQALALISRYFSDQGSVEIEYSSSRPTYLQFHDDASPEALHLVVAFDKNVIVNLRLKLRQRQADRYPSLR